MLDHSVTCGANGSQPGGGWCNMKRDVSNGFL
jgi:hypothetical protein